MQIHTSPPNPLESTTYYIRDDAASLLTSPTLQHRYPLCIHQPPLAYPSTTGPITLVSLRLSFLEEGAYVDSVRINIPCMHTLVINTNQNTYLISWRLHDCMISETDIIKTTVSVRFDIRLTHHIAMECCGHENSSVYKSMPIDREKRANAEGIKLQWCSRKLFL